MRFDGRCHCGNIEVGFETAQPPDSLPLRECGCTFCRRHGSTAVTDPAGRLEVRLRDEREVSRYRFGLRTADFLVCRTCGVFVAAVCTIDGATYATLNANVLERRAAFTKAPVPVGYDAETAAERMARRRHALDARRRAQGRAMTLPLLPATAEARGQRVSTSARMLPSVSLNQAALAPPPVAMPFSVLRPGRSYC